MAQCCARVIMLAAFLFGSVATDQSQALSQRHRGKANVIRNTKVSIADKVDIGERIYTFLRNMGVQVAEDYEKVFFEDVQEGTHTATLPRNFWSKFYRQEMNLNSSAMRRRSGVRALQLFLRRRAGGVARWPA